DHLEVVLGVQRILHRLIGGQILVTDLQAGDETDGGLSVLLVIVSLIDVAVFVEFRHSRLHVSGPARGPSSHFAHERRQALVGPPLCCPLVFPALVGPPRDPTRGPRAPLYSGSAVLRLSRAPAQPCSGSAVLRFSRAPVQPCSGSAVFQLSPPGPPRGAARRPCLRTGRGAAATSCTCTTPGRPSSARR